MVASGRVGRPRLVPLGWACVLCGGALLLVGATVDRSSLPSGSGLEVPLAAPSGSVAASSRPTPGEAQVAVAEHPRGEGREEATVPPLLEPLRPVGQPWSDAGTVPPPTDAAAPDRPRRPPPAGTSPRPVAVEVARLGVSTPLIELGLDAGGRLEVPDEPDVAGWWVGGPRPGDDGPAVLVGHVDSRAGPAVFHRLHTLVAGDRIEVARDDGGRVAFLVDRVERWPKDAFPTDDVYRRSRGAELRLITCGGGFDRDTLRYLDNIIVFARLADGGPTGQEQP
jgi:hypothetical protein